MAWGSLIPWVDQEADPAAAQAAAEAAAARTRNAVRSHYGRPEGATTKVLEGIGKIPQHIVGAGAGMVEQNMRAFDEQFPMQSAPLSMGGGMTISTDYDPRREAGRLTAETALNVIGLPGVMGAAPATLASGAIRRTPGLPMDHESRMARMNEQGYTAPWYHGGERMDRFTELGRVDPKRATSGPMPFFTDNPEMASAYATGKKGDTSLQRADPGDTVANYFTVDPKAIWPGSGPIWRRMRSRSARCRPPASAPITAARMILIGSIYQGSGPARVRSRMGMGFTLQRIQRWPSRTKKTCR